ncbi:hypothetical protein EVAR_38189_1 [Eumeta japonica]|uniref:Uncharacterized protein n=1 Tax=Eumeta variegata TaxID=151549 RepID=A0A4C1WE72_EUMVA|nr:hypothetical protein EVAR_38189_1 [Eumeta japonica]
MYLKSVSGGLYLLEMAVPNFGWPSELLLTTSNKSNVHSSPAAPARRCIADCRGFYTNLSSPRKCTLILNGLEMLRCVGEARGRGWGGAIKKANGVDDTT